MNNYKKGLDIDNVGILLLTAVVAWGWMILQINLWK